MNSNSNQNYCPNIPLHQLYSQATCGNMCEHTTEGAYSEKSENSKLLPSLLKDILMRGKETAKQNYYPHSHTNADIIPSYHPTPDNQINSHNPYQTPAVENPLSEMQSMQFFGNFQCQYQQQEYTNYSQNYLEHNVQLHNNAISIPGQSTVSTQCEQTNPKQRTISNVQELHMPNWYKLNNNSIRQRNKNIETSNYNNRQRGPSSNAGYAWMYKKTNG